METQAEKKQRYAEKLITKRREHTRKVLDYKWSRDTITFYCVAASIAAKQYISSGLYGIAKCLAEFIYLNKNKKSKIVQQEHLARHWT